MTILTRLVRLGRAWWGGLRTPPKAAVAELWCRPATVLALRDPAHASACLAAVCARKILSLSPSLVIPCSWQMASSVNGARPSGPNRSATNFDER